MASQARAVTGDSAGRGTIPGKAKIYYSPPIVSLCLADFEKIPDTGLDAGTSVHHPVVFFQDIQ
jgi:hypothetical protein